MINDSLRIKELICSDFLMYPDNVPECVFSLCQYTSCASKKAPGLIPELVIPHRLW